MAEMNYPARLDSHVSVDAQPTNPSMPLPRVGTGSSFDPHNFTRGMSDSILTLNQREMQDIIKDYYDRMPSHLKTIFYDVMILYAKKDQEAATKFRDHLQNDIILERERRVTAVLYDDEELGSLSGSKVQSLDHAFERCTFTFIFITKSLIKNQFSKISSEGCLMESIVNLEKQWCVVPVYTVSREERDFKIPMMFEALKGVDYFRRDDFYHNGLRRTIGDRVMVRMNKNRDHLEKQYQCACEIRDMECARNIAEKRAIKGNQGLLNTENEKQNGEDSIRSTVPSSLDGASSCKTYSEHKEEHLNPSLQGNFPQSPPSDSERELSTMDFSQAQKETLDLPDKMQRCSLRQLSDLQGEKGEDDEDLMGDGQPQSRNDARYNNGKVEDNEEDVTSSVDTENAGTDVDSGMGIKGEPFRRITDTACSYKEMENLYFSKLSESIGCIEVCGKSLGTGFRVGSKYVMTAYHVVYEILEHCWKDIYKQLVENERSLFEWTEDNTPLDGRWSLNDLIEGSSMEDGKKEVLKEIQDEYMALIQIKFGYVNSDSNNVRELFVSDVPFASASWDVIILEIKNFDKLNICKPIKLMKTYLSCYDLHVIGHPLGSYLMHDQKCQILKTDAELKKLKEEGIKFFEKYYDKEQVKKDYEAIKLSDEEILFHCSESTTKGASGSPLLVGKKPPQVAGMLLKGHPLFFYNEVRKEKQPLRLDLLVESGISMEKLFYLLKEHSLDDLANELFQTKKEV